MSSFNNQMNTINNSLQSTYNNIAENIQSLGETSLEVPSLKTPSMKVPTQPIIETPLLSNFNNTVSSSISPLAQYFELSTGWILFFILLVLMFLGVNIFYVASKGSEVVGDVGEGLFGHIKGLFIWTLMQIRILLGLTSEGTKVAVDVAQGTVDSGLDIVQKTVDAPNSASKDEIDDSNNIEDKLNSGIEVPQPTIEKTEPELIGEGSFNASKVESQGYCYVGNKVAGSCALVKEGDYCMSGNIFPTMSACINKDNLGR